MFTAIYDEWNHTRAKTIIDHFGASFFKGKKVLDLGAGQGEIAASLARLGASVLCVDARRENLDNLKRTHPYLNTMELNLENNLPFEPYQFDIVLSIATLCHLSSYEKHLKDICKFAEYVVLETEVLDNTVDKNAKITLYEERKSNDLSFNGTGTIITANHIEDILSSVGAQFKRVRDAKLNSGPYTYNWSDTNSGRKPSNRAFWFIRRDKYLGAKIENATTSPVNNQPNTNFNVASRIQPVRVNNSSTSHSPPIQEIPRTLRKIKVFIVTYNNPKHLNENLNSLFNSDIKQFDFQIFVINNHSNFSMDEKFNNTVKVIHNSTRPDFSTGHLARNWNQAIINGFKDLNNPDTDIVITSQVDTTYVSDFFTSITNYHQRYSFITDGIGDNMCSYTVDAIKKIGLWDERFCNIGFQEADYFMRALMYNKERSSINDRPHGRVLNPIGKQLVSRPHAGPNEREAHSKSAQWHTISLSVFKEKYGGGHALAEGWKPALINNPPQNTLTKNYVFYPYFEKDIENLIGKNYVWTDNKKYF